MADYEKRVREILKEHGCLFVRHKIYETNLIMYWGRALE